MSKGEVNYVPALVEGRVQLEEEIDAYRTRRLAQTLSIIDHIIPGSVVLQELPPTAAFTFITDDVPPDPNPIASDMEAKNF